MNLSIEIIAQDFFPSVPLYESSSISEAGWTISPSETSSFVEPPLVVSGEEKLQNSKIWLISAPGAVGKSTFAKQLARKTGAIYVDLAKADTIGTNYLTGSLFKSNLIEHMAARRIALLMDALDEASLRVTFESRMHFFDDVITVARNNAFPILIFGRPASIDESQLILEDKGITPALISIDYFTRENAIRLILSMVREKLIYLNRRELQENFDRHQSVARNIINNTLESLDKTANISGKDFSGYAPVLDAVAEYLCRYSNFSQTEQTSQNILEESILEGICRYILEREQKKLVQQLSLDEHEKNNLYNAQEQMRALCHIYAGHMIKDFSFDVGQLPAQKKQLYVQIAQEFIEQHPFLVDGKNPTNEVFSGAIQSFALKQKVNYELEVFQRHTISPLLAEFYFKDDEIYNPNAVRQNKKTKNIMEVETEHIPFLLYSYEALSSQDQKVSLDIVEAANNNYADISIIRYNSEEEKEEELQSFKSKVDGKLIFKQHAGSLTIDCRAMEIEFQSNSTFSLTLPLDIHVKKISFCCPELQFVGTDSVVMTAKECHSEVTKINRFGSIDIYTRWPGSREYPWSVTSPVECDGDEKNADDFQVAFLSFCKLIRAFRSHSKRKLGRFEDKINHSRMSKNFGEAIKNYLMEKGIIRHNVETRMFYLESDRLAKEIGISYDDVIRRNCSEKLRNILMSITRQGA